LLFSFRNFASLITAAYGNILDVYPKAFLFGFPSSFDAVIRRISAKYLSFRYG
jgi:hypothetical protein